MLAEFRELLRSETVLIGVGGILSADDARAKKSAGAQLVQIYSGLVFRGLDLIREVAGA